MSQSTEVRLRDFLQVLDMTALFRCVGQSLSSSEITTPVNPTYCVACNNPRHDAQSGPFGRGESQRNKASHFEGTKQKRSLPTREESDIEPCVLAPMKVHCGKGRTAQAVEMSLSTNSHPVFPEGPKGRKHCQLDEEVPDRLYYQKVGGSSTPPEFIFAGC